MFNYTSNEIPSDNTLFKVNKITLEQRLLNVILLSLNRSLFAGIKVREADRFSANLLILNHLKFINKSTFRRSQVTRIFIDIEQCLLKLGRYINFDMYVS